VAQKLGDLLAEFVGRMGSRKYAFVGAIGVAAHGIPKRTFDLDIIARNPGDFEAASLSLVGMGFRETKPSERFAPAFAKWERREFGADVMLKELWFQTVVRGKKIEQRVTPDREFWRDIRPKGREVFGVDVPVPKPLDLAVFKAVSSVSPGRNPLKAPYDREHALELVRRFSILSGQLRKRAKAMGCLPEVEEFIEKSPNSFFRGT